MTKKPSNSNPKHEPIAVIGMSCIFPQAKDVESFWHNILKGVNAICDPLPGWEAERYLDAGKITTPRGGYLRDLFRFNPGEFGIMPNSIDGGEPDQLLALQVAKRALQDAGSHYLDKDYNHTDTGIVLGHSTYYHRGQINAAQHNICLDQTMDLLKAALPDMSPEHCAAVRANLQSQLPQFNADMCPSEVPNVMTGRIANRLNFTGPNYLIDAACASSLLAVNAAINELRSGNSRMMLAGGVNASLPAEVSVIFTLLDALSRRGMVRPFEEGSDGTLLGEGLGIVVLKRLSDALADKDRIYALVHGVGQSSDGRGLGLLAPSEKGETLAIRRAYESTGIDPSTISLIEAHGTGIPLGDKTEIAALKAVLGERVTEQGSVAIGSVKSMISHCIPAAGMASMIKMCLSLYHKILPPTLCEKINPDLGIDQTPLYVNTTVKPWISGLNSPRRAAIDSFGFGGVNAHAILEEAPAQASKTLKCAPWPAEIFVFAGNSADALQLQLNRIESFVQKRNDCSLGDIAANLWREAKDQTGSYRLALIALDRADLVDKIALARKRLDKSDKPLLGKGGMVYSNRPVEGKVAFLFPGEGSQYIGMLDELAMHFDCVREWFDLWHGTYADPAGSNRTDIVFPPASEMTPERHVALNKRLHEMGIGSEAVFIAGQAMFALLKHLGLAPDAMLGHSSGESSALTATGAVKWDTPAQMADFIRQLQSVSQALETKGQIATGALMAVGLISRDDIAAMINDTNIVIAMENCPTQTIVFGNKDDVEKLAATLADAGAVCEILPFDRGYHTPSFTPMKEGFTQYYKDIDLDIPLVPLYSCASAGLFPQDKEGVRQLAAEQWATTVRFSDTVRAMYEDGIRYFVEVGPGGKLTSFTDQILREKGCADTCVIAASNLESQAAMAQFLNLVGKLYVNGKIGLDGLFAGRKIDLLDFDDLKQKAPSGIFLDNTMPRFHATPELTQLLQAVNAPSAGMDDPYPEYRPFFSEIHEVSRTRFSGSSVLNLSEDRFLQDHVLSGRVSSISELRGLACVPLMVTMEIMAEACVLMAGRIDLSVIEDIHTFDWIALKEGIATLDVQATAEQSRYKAEVFHLGKKVVSAIFSFGTQDFTCAGLPPLEGETWPNRWSEDYEIYQVGMYHGPIFQSIPRIAWNADGIDAALSPVSMNGFFSDGEMPHTVLNPVLLDALSQLPAFWIAQSVGTDFSCFPTKIDRIEFYASCPQEENGLILQARQQPAPDGGHAATRWDFECIDAAGNVLFRAANFQNVYYPVPHTYYQCRHDPLNGFYGAPLTLQNGTDGNLHWHVPHLPATFTGQSNGVFQHIIAHCTLTPAERVEWQHVPGDTETKNAWLFARVAVKDAVRQWIALKTGYLLYPTDIEVGFDVHGTPYTGGWWCARDSFLINAPSISLRNTPGESFVTVTALENEMPVMAVV